MSFSRKQFWTVKLFMLVLLFIVVAMFTSWYGEYRYQEAYRDARSKFLQEFEVVQYWVKNESACIDRGRVYQVIKKGDVFKVRN